MYKSKILKYSRFEIYTFLREIFSARKYKKPVPVPIKSETELYRKN